MDWMPATFTNGHHRNGMAVEFLCAAQLIARGHRVAQPLQSRNEKVDFVVDYKTAVQVKSSAYRNAYGKLVVNLSTRAPGRTTPFRTEGIDVLVILARDTGEWWVIPTAEVWSATNLQLDGPCYARWKDAWHILNPPTL